MKIVSVAVVAGVVCFVAGCNQQPGGAGAASSTCLTRPTDDKIQAAIPESGWKLVAVSDCDGNGARAVWFYTGEHGAALGDLRHADNGDWFVYVAEVTNGYPFVARVPSS